MFECFCANEFTQELVLLPDSDCDKPCDGDPSQICGSNMKLNIYDVETGISSILLFKIIILLLIEGGLFS